MPAPYNLDAHAVEAVLTPCRDAIPPVHIYGQPADMDALAVLAQLATISLLIEDAAQAHGGDLEWTDGRRLGDAACFSFYPGKESRRLWRRRQSPPTMRRSSNGEPVAQPWTPPKYPYDIRLRERMDTLYRLPSCVPLEHLPTGRMRAGAGYAHVTASCLPAANR